MESIASCSICFEEFEGNSSHVPRILPCSHTLCEKCLSELIYNEKIECPECRQLFDATEGGTSFPQNRYILSAIERKTPGTRRGNHGNCPQHPSEELTLFCKNTECQKAICPECLSTKHQGHAVVSIKHHCNELVDGIRAILQCNMEKIKKAQEKSLKEAEDCLEQLKKEKQNVTKKFDEMIEEAEDAKTKLLRTNRHFLFSMRGILDRLDALCTKESQNSTYEHSKNTIESVQEIRKNEKKYLYGVEVFNYMEYARPQQIQIGSITSKQCYVNLNLAQGKSYIFVNNPRSGLLYCPSFTAKLLFRKSGNVRKNVHQAKSSMVWFFGRVVPNAILGELTP